MVKLYVEKTNDGNFKASAGSIAVIGLLILAIGMIIPLASGYGVLVNKVDNINDLAIDNKLNIKDVNNVLDDYNSDIAVIKSKLDTINDNIVKLQEAES